ncbi:phosphoribosyltransferase [Desulfobacterium sp. N47]
MTTNDRQLIFKDRTDAGKRLATALSGYKHGENIVFAIPRGGVPVAAEVAAALKTTLDIIVVRKIPIPHNTEAGYGAVTEDGSLVLNEPMVKYLGLTMPEITRQSEAVRNEIIRRNRLCREILPPSRVEGRTAIVIDDGLASGYTMLAAIQSLRNRKASEVVVAVPVASGTAYDLVGSAADKLICLKVARTDYFAVASYYLNWYDLDDEEVLQYLKLLNPHHADVKE